MKSDKESKLDGHKFSRADRWLIFIFYYDGFVNRGALVEPRLTIPAIVMVYYFKRYKVTTWGTVLPPSYWLRYHRSGTGSYYSMVYQRRRSLTSSL